MALDDLLPRQPGPLRDLVEIDRKARIVTDRQMPQPANRFPRVEPVHLFVDPRRKRRGGNLQRLVMNHQRAERRHGFHNARNALRIERLCQRQHGGTKLAVDPIAELDHERGISRRKHFIFAHGNRTPTRTPGRSSDFVGA